MPQDLVTIARVGAPHGIKGQLKLQLFLEDPTSMWGFSHFHLQKPGETSFYPFKEFKLDEKGGQFYISFNGIQDRDIARQFTHALLAIPKTELAALDEGEFYWSDLEGLVVINQQGKELGVVDHVMETGANDVLVIKGDKHEILVPYVYPEIVCKIDLTGKKIWVNWEE